ncbi:MAG TPA: DUF5667 domain-containing protein [Anaerolineae bacterium]|nr:DUF5667 domain-containing protein [Anaerolineae bacterium]
MTNDTAQILANCLDVLERPGATVEQSVAPYPDQRRSLSELLSIAQALRAAPAVTPSLDFRLDARQQLIARLPSRRSRRSGIVDKFSAWCRRFVNHQRLLGRTAFILFVGMMFGASVAVASAESLPNDMLYPVKRTIEQARLIFTPDAAARSNLCLAFAGERLAEMQRLIDRGRGADAAIAIDDFATQMQAVVAMTQSMPDTEERTSLLARVNESMMSSDAILSRTQERLPKSAQDAVKRAQAVLAEQWNDPSDLQPLVLPFVLPARTATPQPTPEPSRTWPSVTRDASHWPPTLTEHRPLYRPADRSTTIPPHPATGVPTHWSYYRTPVPPVIRTPVPFVRPTYRLPSAPTPMPWVIPTVMSPPFSTPLPRSGWPGSGDHH